MGMMRKPREIGVSQTWQNVFSSRAFGTTYTNTTGKPICVFVRTTGYSAATNCTVNGVTASSANTSNTAGNCTFIVPNGATYVVTSGDSKAIWAELR